MWITKDVFQYFGFVLLTCAAESFCAHLIYVRLHGIIEGMIINNNCAQIKRKPYSMT